VSVSTSGKYLAICERHTRAQCTIYDIGVRKLKKIIPDQDQEVDYKTKEFLSVCFSPKNDKQNLFTFCGDPDWTILLWRWDELKILNKISLNYVDTGLAG